MESTPASIAMRNPSPPRAWHMTRRPSVWASSTSAIISSRLNAWSLGPWPGRELAPPVVAHLITSAPARTMVRTTLRTSCTPLATPEGVFGLGCTQQQCPEGLM